MPPDASAAPVPRVVPPFLRPLGRTGLTVSAIGFGAFKIGRNTGIKYPVGYELPDEETVAALLDEVLSFGIRHVDTAPAYGSSEERIGRHLAGRRAEFVLSTKVGETYADGRSTYDFTAAGMRASVERSLSRLRTDAVDLLLLHVPGNDLEVLETTEAVPTLLELKRTGRARAVGLSGKTVAAARSALEWADVLMVEYHLLDRTHEALLGEAAARGTGVLVKKGLAAGRLSPAEAIPFVLSRPEVSGLVLGGLDPRHLAENVALARRVAGA